MLSKESLTAGTDEWGVRIRIFTAALTCERACAVGIMNFTYTGETIVTADADDTTVEAVTDAAGLAGRLANGRSRHGHGEITYDSGAHYVGGWVRGKRSGHGRMVFPHGDTYEGEWRDGMYHGRGKYLSRDSDEYDGEWREDKMCGNGKYLYRESGDVYAGGWDGGFREGFGKFTKANGDVFVGQYEAGELIKRVQLDRHSLEMGVDQDGKRIKFITATASGNLSLAAGLGHFTYTGDTIASADAQDTTVMAVTNDEGVAGHLASGRSRHGQGQIRYDTGSHYVGGWVRGKRSGTGKMEFACGDCYEGGWFRGMYNGYGKYISSTSDEYEGEWRADKMEGRGKITHYETGDVWEGTFVDGKKEGVGTLTSASGKVEQCEYRGGELVVASKVDAPPTVKAVAAVEEKAARDKATVERLQEELERRRGEVDKINALEEKIALEMSQLNLKQNDMQWEIDHGYKPRPDAERDADLKSIEATHLAFQERETSNAVTTLLASAKSPSDAAELAAEIGHVVREIESLIRERKEVLAPMIKDLRRRRQEIQETENLLWTRKAASEASAEQARKLEAAVAASVAAAPPAPASVAASELEPALMARMHEENAELKGRVAVLEHEASDLRSQFSTLEAQVAQLQELVGQRGAVNQAAAEEGSSVAAFAAFPAFPPDGGGLTWPADGDMITHAQAILPHVQAIIAAASPPPSPPLLKAPSPPTKLKKSTAATSGEKPAAPAGKLKLPAPAGMLKMPAPGSGSTSAASNRGGKASERGGQDSNRGQGSTRLTPRKQKKKPAAQRKPSTEITGKPSAIEAVPLDKPTGGEAEVGALKKVAPTITEEEAPHVAEVDEATVRKTKELAAKEVEMLEYMCKELRMRAIVRVSPSERQAAREEYKQRRAQLAAAQARVVSVHSNDDFKAYAASLRSLTASYKRTRAEVYESISGETSGHGSLQERPEDTAAYQKLKTSTLEAIHGGSLSAALDAIRRLSTIPMLTSELVAELLAAASKAPNLREEVLLRTSELEISEVAGHKIELVKLAARWRAAEAKDDPARRTIDEFEAKLTASAFHGV